MDLLKYMVLSGASLFVIIDPIATVPAFLAMTPKDGPDARIRMARLACIIAACVLIIFVVTGRAIFDFLGITIPAFKIAGSIVLLLVALDMLRARRSPVRETVEETYAGAEKDDIAITPLAVPMLAGPGAISTTILLHAQSRDLQHTLALVACILIVCAACYIVFRIAAKGATRFISPIAMKIVERLMGLLLTAVAIQFAINGFIELGVLPPLPKISSP